MPGGYSICEPYVPDFSLNDFSVNYDILDVGPSYGSVVKVTSGRAKKPRSVRRPKKIQNNGSSRAKWIKNPFYKDPAKNGQKK